MTARNPSSPLILVVLATACFSLEASAIASRPPRDLAGLVGAHHREGHETSQQPATPTKPAATAPAKPKAGEPASFEDFGFEPSSPPPAKPGENTPKPSAGNTTKLADPSGAKTKVTSPAATGTLASLSPRPEPLPALRPLQPAVKSVDGKPGTAPVSTPRRQIVDGAFMPGKPVTTQPAAKPRGGETKPESKTESKPEPKAEPKTAPKSGSAPAAPAVPAKPSN